MQQLSEGTLLQRGKYRIERVLGQGGFGITYLATNVWLGGRVAIKEFFFHQYCYRDAQNKVQTPAEEHKQIVERFKQKFLKEARTIFGINHPNIVRVLDVFAENNTYYYVMEYIEGRSLDDIVKRDGSIPEAKAISFIKEVGSALSFLHKNNISHLDIKPANILCRRSDNHIFLIDFGVSKHYDSESSGETSTTPVATSPGYAPTEQYLKNGVQSFSPQSDVYSLAATLYKLLTGSTPPESIEISQSGLSPAELSNKGVSSKTIKAITLAMQTREERTQSIDEFIKQISTRARILTRFFNFMLRRSVSRSTCVNIKQQEETYPKSIGTNDAFSLGYKYYNGQGVPQNYEEAVRWYKKAAEQGNARAQYNLGFCYYYGHGVPQNYEEAVKWYKKAAEQGNAEAQSNLGFCNYYGHGVPQNYEEAVRWYKKAVEQGNAMAQNNLGVCYEKGQGVPQNYEEAVRWYKKTAEQGDAIAQCNLGFCYEKGHGVPQNYEEAVKWYKDAAKQGHAISQRMLGICYKCGDGVPQNFEEAAQWFEKAASQGDDEAQIYLKQCKEEIKGLLNE